MMTLLVY